MSRHPRRAIAAETVAILEQGFYVAPSGRTVAIADRQARAVAGTRLYRPGDLTTVPPDGPRFKTRIAVTAETTLQAAASLTAPACLNFASAKNPGGGFLNGAHAQEEGLARSSGLYPTLLEAGEFYEFHRAQGDLLYSDHMIYSPGVPVFRDDGGALLEEPYEVAFLTSPAPNRGAIRDPEHAARIPEVLRTRAAKVLTMAHLHGHTELVLGAWGCGVFRNRPDEVAKAFGEALEGPFAGVFEHVVFAVWDTAKGSPTLGAFQNHFST